MRQYIDIINEASEPMVVLQFEGESPQEPVSLASLFEINEDGIDEEERMQITRELAKHGSYSGGGGAAAAWKLTLVR